MTTTILIGDALEMLKTLPDESVHCCITSPPYWGLRDYGITGQMGLEATPEEFLANMVEVFREVRRVLRSDGTCFINMGDSYQDKQLMGMPWRLALALQADGWWLRSDIIWAKPNPMPESVTDRPTKAHEYVFLLTKSARYYYDAEAVREESTHQNGAAASFKRETKDHLIPNQSAMQHRINRADRVDIGSRNRRTVWTIEQDEGLPDTPDTVELTEEQTQAIYDILASGQSVPPDAPEPTHEYVFLLTKSAKYFYDNEAVKEGSIYPDDNRKLRSANGQKRLPTEKIAGVRPGSATYPTRNRRTIWTIATQPFSAAHFATFPTKLVEPMIKAGTSEKGCCPECGGPWVRVVEKDTTLAESRRGDENYKSGGLATGSKFASATPGYSSKVTTTGWQPSCDCKQTKLHKGEQVRIEYEPVPCIAIDPFAGACTVGLVADRLGRDSIMIELNPKYADMGRERIVNDAGWLAEVEVADSKPEQARLI